jgi:predicted metal-dependent peptidase
MDNKTELYHLKNQFLEFLLQHQMFFTMSLFGCVEVGFTEQTPIAYMGYSTSTKTFQMGLNKTVLSFSLGTRLFVMLHELRHVAQSANIEATLEQIGWGRPDLPIELKHKVFNIAADIALNQDVAKLLVTGKVFKDYDECIGKVKEEIGGGCFVEQLIEDAAKEGIEVLRDKDYVYYANKILEMNNDFKGQGFDEHGFCDGSGAEAEAAAKKALQKANEGAAKLARQAGRDAADSLTTITGKHETTAKIRAFLKSLKIKVGVAGKVSYDTRKTWGRKHRKRDMFPGRRRVDGLSPGVVLILDTSGSMYQEDMLKGLVAVAQELVTQKKLAAAYCCDTELHPLTIGNMVGMKGGGGTMLTNEHMASIMTEHDVEKLTVLYVTDEEVDLREVKSNPDVELLIINLPKELRND